MKINIKNCNILSKNYFEKLKYEKNKEDKKAYFGLARALLKYIKASANLGLDSCLIPKNFDINSIYDFIDDKYKNNIYIRNILYQGHNRFVDLFGKSLHKRGFSVYESSILTNVTIINFKV